MLGSSTVRRYPDDPLHGCSGPESDWAVIGAHASG